MHKRKLKEILFIVSVVFSVIVVQPSPGIFACTSPPECPGAQCGPNWDPCACNPSCGGCACGCCDYCCSGGSGGGPVCGNGSCESGEDQSNCCADCGTPCDGTAANIRGNLCPGCPGGSCFCHQTCSGGTCTTNTSYGCNSGTVYGYLLEMEDGTQVAATLQDVQDLSTSGTSFKVIQEPTWSVTEIFCGAAEASSVSDQPIDGSSAAQEQMVATAVYVPSGNFVRDVLSADFQQAFWQETASSLGRNAGLMILLGVSGVGLLALKQLSRLVKKGVKK